MESGGTAASAALALANPAPWAVLSVQWEVQEPNLKKGHSNGT